MPIETAADRVMADIIEVDFHLVWRYPVFIRTVESQRQRIEGPDAALDALNNSWATVRAAATSKRSGVASMRFADAGARNWPASVSSRPPSPPVCSLDWFVRKRTKPTSGLAPCKASAIVEDEEEPIRFTGMVVA